MRVEVLTAQAVAGGICIRFRAATQDDFDAMRLRVKALSRYEAQWQPRAFEDKGGWWLSERAWQRIGPLFANYAEVQRQLAEEAGPASSPPHPIPPQVEQAFAVLHLRPTAPPWVVQAVYRVLAKRSHPDAGGSHERMKVLNLAYEVAAAWAETHAA